MMENSDFEESDSYEESNVRTDSSMEDYDQDESPGRKTPRTPKAEQPEWMKNKALNKDFIKNKIKSHLQG